MKERSQDTFLEEVYQVTPRVTKGTTRVASGAKQGARNPTYSCWESPPHSSSAVTTLIPPGSQLQGAPGQQSAVPGEPQEAALHGYIQMEQPADGPVGPGESPPILTSTLQPRAASLHPSGYFLIQPGAHSQQRTVGLGAGNEYQGWDSSPASQLALGLSSFGREVGSQERIWGGSRVRQGTAGER